MLPYSSIVLNFTYTSTREELITMEDPYQVQHNFKVSIRLQDNIKAIQQINSK
jgi:hypothetical protein